MTEAPASGYKAYASKIRQWGCAEMKYKQEEIWFFYYGVYFEMGVLQTRENKPCKVVSFRKSIHELRIASFILAALDRISIDK